MEANNYLKSISQNENVMNTNNNKEILKEKENSKENIKENLNIKDKSENSKELKELKDKEKLSNSNNSNTSNTSSSSNPLQLNGNGNIEIKVKEFLQKVQINKFKTSERGKNKASQSHQNIISENHLDSKEIEREHKYQANSRVKQNAQRESKLDLEIKEKEKDLISRDKELNTKEIEKQKSLKTDKDKVASIAPRNNQGQKRTKSKPNANLEDNVPKITDILNLVEEEKPEEEISLMHRIRLNRKGKLVIDRYFKSANSTNPFDNTFDNSYNMMKKYEEDLGRKFFEFFLFDFFCLNFFV